MTIITHLKITFTITFLSGLIYWNLLIFSCEYEGISSFEVVPECFLLTLGKIQFLENHLPRDNKLTLNYSPSGLSIGVEMLTQRHKILGCLNNVLSISAFNTGGLSEYLMPVSLWSKLNTDQFLDLTTFITQTKYL